ncbi:hypothetical protein [Phytoactinopolyspora endophytica]|uniref:hypothetical protein n=1 Tax=Phytoactinopolyspora endophytica TaxID=1642495 RepID=UPI0013EB619F|nr:hypothetical protein [Phytoactinopolyspora endophytica]
MFRTKTSLHLGPDHSRVPEPDTGQLQKLADLMEADGITGGPIDVTDLIVAP